MKNIFQKIIAYSEEKLPPPFMVLLSEDESKIDQAQMKAIGFKKQKQFWTLSLQKAIEFARLYHFKGFVDGAKYQRNDEERRIKRMKESLADAQEKT